MSPEHCPSTASSTKTLGWYIHHQGSGHLQRAMTMALHLSSAGWQVTGLSSVSQPAQWPGEWVQLERDDTMHSSVHCRSAGPSPSTEPVQAALRDITAGGALHFAPIGHPGIRRRSTQISSWIEAHRPCLMVVDVSVEVALLARLHGIAVMTVALPGNRTDAAHQLGFRLSAAIVGMWPPAAKDIVTGIPENSKQKFYALGGLSRFPPIEATQGGLPDPAAHTDCPSIVVLNGAGGGALSARLPQILAQNFPEAEVTVLGGPGGTWVEDPWPMLCQADVVITAAGQNSIAEVAASRTPAVVVAHPRPHDEQYRMLDTLMRGPWPVVPAPETESGAAWGRAVKQALRLDGRCWSSWCDDEATKRFTQIVQSFASNDPRRQR